MLKEKQILIAPLGLVGLTVLSGAFLMSSYSFADDSVVDNVSITVPVSCSLEGTGMNSHSGASLVSYVKIIRGTKKQSVFFLINGQGLGKYDINGCYLSIRTIGLDYRQPLSDEKNPPDDMPMFTINYNRNPDNYYCGANWFLDEM